MKLRDLSIGALVTLATCSCCMARSLVEWSVSSGGNGHFYEVVKVTTSIDWNAARAAAEARGGYLATLTSAGENAFVAQLVTQSGENAFLGGYQATPTAPANETWTWVTGETWNFTSWAAGEPNDQGSNEAYLEMWTNTYWNDCPVSGSNYSQFAYVVEVVPSPAGVAVFCLTAPLMRARRRR